MPTNRTEPTAAFHFASLDDTKLGPNRAPCEVCHGTGEFVGNDGVTEGCQNCDGFGYTHSLCVVCGCRIHVSEHICGECGCEEDGI